MEFYKRIDKFGEFAPPRNTQKPPKLRRDKRSDLFSTVFSSSKKDLFANVDGGSKRDLFANASASKRDLFAKADPHDRRAMFANSKKLTQSKRDLLANADPAGRRAMFANSKKLTQSKRDLLAKSDPLGRRAMFANSRKKLTQSKRDLLVSSQRDLLKKKSDPDGRKAVFAKTVSGSTRNLFAELEQLSLNGGFEKNGKIPSSLSLAQLVNALTEELKGGGEIDTDRIGEMMRNYDHTQGEWRRYAFYNKKKLYTRNLIATDNETFTLMILVWNPSAWSPIHDHAGVDCVLRCIQGEVHEKIYKYPDDDPKQELEYIKTSVVKPGESAFINDSIAVHAVGNVSTEVGITLHCYMPPYDKCRCFLGETVGEAIEAHVTFDSENGELSNLCVGDQTDITSCSYEKM